jgi:hypothetical protein
MLTIIFENIDIYSYCASSRKEKIRDKIRYEKY